MNNDNHKLPFRPKVRLFKNQIIIPAARSRTTTLLRLHPSYRLIFNLPPLFLRTFFNIHKEKIKFS